jgi:predicted ABC-type exoprotein transport system permease subunit
MFDSPAQRALSASSLALALAVAAVVMFMPPLVDHTLGSWLRIVATALLLALALALHWVFLGIGARRLERSAPRWVALSVLLFPIGSAAALILLRWAGTDEPAHTPAPHRG